ncbi:methyltransferase domain-containing protein [Gemmobacter fulva]|nr:methyltransferase domain-containing protein [Gemmobacter fulvus]
MRLRPALDLLMQTGTPPAGDIIDLGCGDGAMAAALRARFPKRRLVGVDASPAMLAQARGYDATAEADIAQWQPDTRPALIFSNAVLQWLPDHAQLMLHLAGLLAPGGILAVQMPRQSLAPSHRFMRDIAAALFPDRFDFSGYEPPVWPAQTYWRLLAPLGTVEAWQTDYMHRLDPADGAHPVRRFTESTAMRPFLAQLTAEEADHFRAAYDEALAHAYPAEADGAVLMPFRRVFFTLTLPV